MPQAQGGADDRHSFGSAKGTKIVVDYFITLFLLSIICDIAVHSNAVGYKKAYNGYMKQMKKNAVGWSPGGVTFAKN